MTQSTFWTEVQNYYAMLEKKFEIEISKVKRTEEEKYNTIISEQKKESERQKTSVSCTGHVKP
ncbi:Hypothetical predicted protein [Mytilus galloprovincialis]|uniref:Uncharacterized protein n=1 Tax=Mytilus galloprovincialis TaxID=29158 RepID=A0A8B6ENN1_MYTGA|nr:Hypothetical predicted protein [Mytilus galloprovincialis]